MNNLNNHILYTCPMHPNIKQKHKGMCPECGMNLVLSKNSSHSCNKSIKHKHKSVPFLKKFWISLILTIPILIYSDFPQKLFDWEAPAFSLSIYLSGILGSIIFFYGGEIFLTGA